MPMITVSIPPHFAADINAAVESGAYASESEVIRDALRLWSESNGTAANRIKLASARGNPTPRDGEGLMVAELFHAHELRMRKRGA